MKKVKSFLTSIILTFSFLQGCNNSVPNTFIDVNLQNPVNQNVSIQSDYGLNKFVNVMQKEIFNAFDENKDRFITPNEFSNFPDFVFEAIDLDKNGRISFAEAVRAELPLFTQDGETLRDLNKTLFENYLDQDKDSFLSRDEFLGFYLQGEVSKNKIQYFKTLYTKNDINKDNKLTFSEFEDSTYQLLRRDIEIVKTENGLIIRYKGYDK